MKTIKLLILCLFLLSCNDTIKDEHLIDDIEKIGCISISNDYKVLKNERVDYPDDGGDFVIYFELKFGSNGIQKMVSQIKNNSCGFVDHSDSTIDKVDPFRVFNSETWTYYKGIYYNHIDADDRLNLSFDESSGIFKYTFIHY